MTDEPNVLPSGNRIELFEPVNSGEGPMQSGRCPGCQNGLRGYQGRCAAIREVDQANQAISGEHTTSYGHYDCVRTLFDALLQRIKEPDTNGVRGFWTHNTQREMVLYVQRRGLEGKAVAVQYMPDAARDHRYVYRTIVEEMK